MSIFKLASSEFSEGRNAYKQSLVNDSFINPYKKGTESFNQWNNGFQHEYNLHNMQHVDDRKKIKQKKIKEEIRKVIPIQPLVYSNEYSKFLINQKDYYRITGMSSKDYNDIKRLISGKLPKWNKAFSIMRVYDSEGKIQKQKLSNNWFQRIITSESDSKLNNKVKILLSENNFVQKMFEKAGVPIQMLDTVKFKFKKLNKVNAMSDAKCIIINEKYNDQNFYDKCLHIVIHELYHWLKRTRQNTFYMADPQEIEAFAAGFAFELNRGKSLRQIIHFYRPIIEKHFENSENFKDVFTEIIKKAQQFNKKD